MPQPLDAAPEFDTMAAMRKLEAVGIDRKQAQAHTEALRDNRARLATGADIRRIEEKMATKTDLARLEARMYGVFVALAAAVIAAGKYL